MLYKAIRDFFVSDLDELISHRGRVILNNDDLYEKVQQALAASKQSNTDCIVEFTDEEEEFISSEVEKHKNSVFMSGISGILMIILLFFLFIVFSYDLKLIIDYIFKYLLGA